MTDPNLGRLIPWYGYRAQNQLSHTSIVCWVAWMLILGTSCHTRNVKLLFQTGFEEGSTLTQSGQNADISGRDLSVEPPNDWVTDLEGNARTGDFSFYYQGGTVADRYAAIVRDPTGGANNRVLKFWLKHGVVPRGSGGRGAYRPSSTVMRMISMNFTSPLLCTSTRPSRRSAGWRKRSTT